MITFPQYLFQDSIISSPLNYTGGKYKLLPQILPLLLTDTCETFVDLFCGGANVGINISSPHILLNDSNKPLLGLFKTLKDLNIEDIFKIIYSIIEKYTLSQSNRMGYQYYGCTSAEGLAKYNKQFFLALRHDFNVYPSQDNYYYLMLYVLIVFSFNNQIRFNHLGEFNLPVGKRDFNDCMQSKLEEFVDRLQNQRYELSCKDFRDIDPYSFQQSDFIYADPPYLLACATYNEQDAWNEEDERELYKWLDSASSNGTHFALSNILRKGNKINNILTSWLEENKNYYKIIHLDFSYSNSNYQKHDRQLFSDEILVMNY